MTHLFRLLQPARLPLKNRIILAPITRSRASEEGDGYCNYPVYQ